MSVLIDVTPTVHEKFKNYKKSSSFRDKTDAELLEYFLDSFEVITCIGVYSVFRIYGTGKQEFFEIFVSSAARYPQVPCP